MPPSGVGGLTNSTSTPWGAAWRVGAVCAITVISGNRASGSGGRRFVPRLASISSMELGLLTDDMAHSLKDETGSIGCLSVAVALHVAIDQIISRLHQSRISLLNLSEHFIEGIDQNTHFI